MSVSLRSALFVAASIVSAVFSTPAATAQLNAQEQAIFSAMANSSEQRRAFVRVDAVLTQVARARAADLARRDYFAHVNPDGHGPNYLVQRAGYKLPASYGTSTTANYIESIAAGRSSASATWSDWMGSSGHKAHLVASNSFYADQTSVGVGYYFDSGSTYQHYWVVLTAPAQVVAPLLTVTAPAVGARVTAPRAGVAGTTAGTPGAALVQYRVENSGGAGSFLNASGTGSFSGAAENLVPGPNIVRVRSMDGTGRVLNEAARAVHFSVVRSLTVGITGEGRVTTGFLGTTNRELGVRYTVAAVPAAGWLFQGWTGSTTSSAATLSFTMEEGYALQAVFVPNPYAPYKGSYSGLVGGIPWSADKAGSIQATIAATGTYTGRLVLAGRAYTLRGAFDLTGISRVSLPRAGTTPLVLDLNLDLAGNAGVAGQVVRGEDILTFSAPALVRPTLATPLDKVGRYNAVFFRRLDAAGNVPFGHGISVITVAATGAVRMTVRLPDGFVYVLASGVRVDGDAAFYLANHSLKGAFTGRLKFQSDAVSDLGGTIEWERPALVRALHPGAFSTSLTAVGSRWVAPKFPVPMLAVPATAPNAAIYLDGGNLTEPATQLATLDNYNRLRPAPVSLAGFTATLYPSNGTYTGSFIHPVSKTRKLFYGVLIQKQNAGFGFFAGVDCSGSQSFEALPVP